MVEINLQLIREWLGGVIVKLRGTMRVNSEGVLTVGNVSTKQFAIACFHRK